jgi:molybdate transport system permease protein
MNRPPLPWWIVPLAFAAVAFVAVPMLGLLLRIPWVEVPALLAAPAARDALRLSLATCVASTAASVTLGLPLALLLSRASGRGMAAVRTLAVLPMVLPPVVAGLALLTTLGRRGVLGQYLSVLGIEIGFTTLAVIIAQTFVSMPFFVVSVEAALRTLDSDLEHAAALLGAAPGMVMRRVTVPLLMPAIIGGATLSFARSLGEFGATLTFAGSLQGVTRTLPIEIYLQREADPHVALALSLFIIATAGLLMALGAAYTRRVAGRRG